MGQENYKILFDIMGAEVDHFYWTRKKENAGPHQLQEDFFDEVAEFGYEESKVYKRSVTARWELWATKEVEGESLNKFIVFKNSEGVEFFRLEYNPFTAGALPSWVMFSILATRKADEYREYVKSLEE